MTQVASAVIALVAYPTSKLLGVLTTPSSGAITVALVGVLLARHLPRFGRSLAVAGLLTLVLDGMSPLSAWLAAPLEDRFPAPRDLGAVAGIVALGGGVDEPKSMLRGQIVLNDAAERVIALSDLARRYPGARVAYVGTGEASALRRFADTLLLDSARMIYEENSRDTHENAVMAAALLHPQANERWLLVTSAWHMPRAVGSFRAAGFDIIPYPVDYRTGGEPRPISGSMGQGLANLDRVVKEWIGLVAYRLAGYTDVLFPAP